MIWRSCERLSVRPPGVKIKWEDNNWWMQGLIVGYNQIREHEEMEILQASLSTPRLF